MSRRYAVVGASLAGVNAAERLSQVDPASDIHLFDSQPHQPYDKPPLSKRAFESVAHHQEIQLRADDFWTTSSVRPQLGVGATALHGLSLSLTDRTAASFDGIILATGGRPRTPAFVGNWENVSTLRTIEDAVVLHKALVPGSSLVIVGGGFIGLELAAVAVKAGVSVTVVEPFEVPLMRPIGRTAGEWIAARHREKGVQFIQSGVVGLVGEGSSAQHVILEDGRGLAADHVLVCVGMVPNVEWLEGSGVEIENGVMCETTLQTTVPHVFAAGDIANWFNPVYGRRMRVEHHTTAVAQGRAAADNLVAGLDGREMTPFAHVPYVWSDQYDMKIQTTGTTGGDLEARVVEDAPGKLVVEYFDADEHVGALAINSPAYIMKLRRAFSERELDNVG